jgi:cell division protease FtsH
MSQIGNRLAKPPTEFKSRPKPSERTTRSPVALWDRVRILSLLLGGFLLLVWSDMAASPSGNLSFREALRDNVQSRWWLLALAGLELVRQFHYFIQEQSPAYYRWWMDRTEGVSKRTGKMNPWTRFRLARVFKWIFILTIADLIFAAMIHEPPITALFVAPARFLAALPLALQLAFGFFFVIIQFVGLYWFLSRGGIDTIMPDEIETRFTDVKGQDAALGQLQETLVFLEDPDAIEEKGGFVPGGILLWGPPGTGKTLMAQAVAGETGRPFVSVEPAAFIQMFMGIGPLKVKGLYRKLRRLAMRYGGVIVFFDEADSLGSRGASSPAGERETSPWNTQPGCNGMTYVSAAGRHTVFDMNPPGLPAAGGSTTQIFMGGMGGGGGMGTLQALLSEMSGLAKPRGLVNRIRKMLGMKPKPPPKYRILHIFATNMPDALDQAMLRPGRVDRSYKVGYPQKEGRMATFRYYFAKVKHQLSDDDMDKLATITPYFSGASIKDIVNEALVIAIREGRDTVSYADVIRAKQLKQHGLPDDHEYIERERHSVAVHEACHAVVMYRLRKHAIIDMATIERRGDVGGFVASIPPEDQFVEWRSEREIDVMTFVASLAGERLFFEGDHTTGVGGDMRGATAITTQMHAYYAMGDTIAARSISLGALRLAQPIETGEDRALFDTEFGKSVDAKLKELYERTMVILEENRHEVLALAHALEVHKTLTGEDVAAVIDGNIGPNIDGRTYHDERFAQELESYHAAVIEAHREHGGVQWQIPIPIPPAPVEVLVASTPKAAAAGRVTNRTQMRAGPSSPPRPDA